MNNIMYIVYNNLKFAEFTESESQLVALIPLSDDRLKPSRTLVNNLFYWILLMNISFILLVMVFCIYIAIIIQYIFSF